MASADMRKAAVLLTSLPEDDAAALLSRLTPKQVEAVSIEIARLGSIGGTEHDAVMREFAEASPASAPGGVGGLSVAKMLVERALGKDASATMENVKQQVTALPFAFLQKVDTQNLLTFILDEHPQTVALILAHLNPQQAASVVAGLPPERQISVIRRIATMGQTNPEIISEVERALQQRLSAVMSQSFEKAGGVKTVASILNVTDRTIERAILDNISQDDSELVTEIRNLMFVFEDIRKLTDKDIQTLLKNVENPQLALALKNSSEELKTKVLGNMSTRAAEMLKEEMGYLGPVKRASVDQVQQQIVEIVRRLEEAGELTINVGEETEELIS